MRPGWCESTDDGREYLHKVRAASAQRAHIEETYSNALSKYEGEWLRMGQLGREALRAFTQKENRKMHLLDDQYVSRDVQYAKELKLLQSEYDGAVLSVHYEPVLGDVKWWRPFNREHRVFKRLAPGEFTRVCTEVVTRKGRT